jgi:hypothetical protein
MGILGGSTAPKTSQDTLSAHRTFPYTNQKRKWKDAIKSLIEADEEPGSDIHEG